jgi:signal transduction histidine kinase
MSLSLSMYAYIYFLAALVSLATAWVCWRRHAISGGIPLTLLLLALTIWAVSDAFEIIATHIPTRVFWSQVSYIGITCSPILLLIFALEFSRQRPYITNRKLALIWILPLLLLAVAFTNEWHNLVWTSFTPSPLGGNVLIYGHGPWFWVVVAYSYLTLFASFYILAHMLVKFQAPYRRQAWIMLISVGVPFAVNAIYSFDLGPLPGLELAPIAFIFSSVLIVFGLFRFQLLDLVPVAHDLLIANMTDGLIVLDGRNRIVDINPTARKFIGANTSPIGLTIESVCPPIAQHSSDTSQQHEITLNRDSNWTLGMNSSTLHDRRNNPNGYLIVLSDITEHKKMETALKAMNTNLEQSVAARTAELEEMIGKLQSEIAERTRMETSLRRMEETLAQRVADQSRKLSALYKVILFAGKSLSIQELQEQSLKTIIAVMNGDAGCIHYWDERHQVLQLAAHQGLSLDMQTQITTIPPGWLLQDRIPHTITHLSTHPSAPPAIRLPGFDAYIGVPTHLHSKPTGALSIFWKNSHTLAVEDIALFSVMADQLEIIVENARLRERREAAAVLRERRRLARDLHDSVTQSLQSLTFSAYTATNRLKQGKLDRLEASLTQMSDSARQAIKEMRLLLYDLRLTPLEHVSFAEAIQLRLDAVEKRAGIDAHFDLATDAPLPRTWENEIYCITMEALNNSLKHASASQVHVRLHGDEHGIELTIADNGKGIDPASKKSGGMGLDSMTERAERIGGMLKITSTPGTGTQVRLEIQKSQ